MEMLSEKQEIVLKEIIKYISKNKFAPSVREMAEIVGLRSTSTVQGYLDRLEKKGYIEKRATQCRTIRVIKMP